MDCLTRPFDTIVDVIPRYRAAASGAVPMWQTVRGAWGLPACLMLYPTRGHIVLHPHSA
jgi:hypothetical protein